MVKRAFKHFDVPKEIIFPRVNIISINDFLHILQNKFRKQLKPLS